MAPCEQSPPAQLCLLAWHVSQACSEVASRMRGCEVARLSCVRQLRGRAWALRTVRPQHPPWPALPAPQTEPVHGPVPAITHPHFSLARGIGAACSLTAPHCWHTTSALEGSTATMLLHTNHKCTKSDPYQIIRVLQQKLAVRSALISRSSSAVHRLTCSSAWYVLTRRWPSFQEASQAASGVSNLCPASPCRLPASCRHAWLDAGTQQEWPASAYSNHPLTAYSVQILSTTGIDEATSCPVTYLPCYTSACVSQP